MQHEPGMEVALLLCNNPSARVVDRAKAFSIPVVIRKKASFYKQQETLDLLKSHQIDWIVLAGFMLLVPAGLVRAYKNRIINIHPALLPGYGGKGMYGEHVHRAVLEAGESHSGISIHYVNEHYDEGALIFQATCPVLPNDTPEKLANRIHTLEHRYFPAVVASEVRKNSKNF